MYYGVIKLIKHDIETNCWLIYFVASGLVIFKRMEDGEQVEVELMCQEIQKLFL